VDGEGVKREPLTRFKHQSASLLTFPHQVDKILNLPELVSAESANEQLMILPWDVHTDLTADRLIKVADLVTSARGDAVAWHNPEIGDDNWVLGCRAFQACRFQIQRETQSGDSQWLTILDESKHFVFRIGAVPVRFYRGEPEDQNHRTRRQSFPELAQMAMAFPGEDVLDLVYRFAVETDFDGQVSSVSFVGLLGDNVVVYWPIPLKSATTTPFAAMRPPAAGVELRAPVVGSLKPNKTKAGES
jgi:hypothetical protein